jgi:hypothetical protein
MTPEGLIKNAIMDYLQAIGVVAWRMNTGAVQIEKRFIQFSIPGFSDILAIPTVRGQFKGIPVSWTMPLFIEVKTPTGRQSNVQMSFERQVKDAGADYQIWRSVDDAQEWMRKNGVK